MLSARSLTMFMSDAGVTLPVSNTGIPAASTMASYEQMVPSMYSSMIYPACGREKNSSKSFLLEMG